MKYKLILSIVLFAFFVACNSPSEQDKVSAKVSAFQTAVNAKDNVALKALVSSDTNDYSLLQGGTYFSSSAADIFSLYTFNYYNIQATVTGDTATVTTKVTATSRADNLPLSSVLTATFSFKKQSEDWFLIELKQVKTPGSSTEDVLLDEILEINNGTILH